MTSIYPVLLCGGSGTRLWPLSRKRYPKQFSVNFGGHSLFQQSALRSVGTAFMPPIVVTGEEYRFVASEQLRELDMVASTLMIEPSGKNTAPAILAATLRVMQDDPDALLLITPTDHLIPDITEFQNSIKQGMQAASEGRLVTFGITPDRAETGYGYLKVGEKDAHGTNKLDAFVEKPVEAEAKRMLEAGGYLWNAGIFMFKASTMVEAFKRQEPAMLEGVKNALDGARNDLDFSRLDAQAWDALPDVSIDYAIMEREDNLSVIPFNGQWSDLGDWQAMHRELPGDENNNVSTGPVSTINCSNTMLRAESESQHVVGIGLNNLLVVAMQDAVLVADQSQAQNVKEAVSILKETNIKQAESFLRDDRPWGWYETLALSDRFQVKRIVVKPGGCLSLQSHFHRSEHWIVVAGTARVTIGEDVKLVTENESVYIPLGAIHRMENPGKLPMVLIEVQTGTYFGEDDIVRYEDIYARS